MTPTVVFKYAEDETLPGAVIAPYSSIKVEDPNEEKDATYFDALNTWVSARVIYLSFNLFSWCSQYLGKC